MVLILSCARAGLLLLSAALFFVPETSLAHSSATRAPAHHSARLKRCAIIDEGSGSYHYWVGIYPARDVSCAKSKFLFRRTSHRPDRYVTVTQGQSPWLVWRDGWGCEGHSIWVCLYRFRNPIRKIKRLTYSAECGAGAGCPLHLRVQTGW